MARCFCPSSPGSRPQLPSRRGSPRQRRLGRAAGAGRALPTPSAGAGSGLCFHRAASPARSRLRFPSCEGGTARGHQQNPSDPPVGPKTPKRRHLPEVSNEHLVLYNRRDADLAPGADERGVPTSPPAPDDGAGASRTRGTAGHTPAEDGAPEPPGVVRGFSESHHARPAGRRSVVVLRAGVLAAPGDSALTPGTPGRPSPGPRFPGWPTVHPRPGPASMQATWARARRTATAGSRPPPPPSDGMLMSMHHWACQVPRPWRGGHGGRTRARSAPPPAHPLAFTASGCNYSE